MELAVSGAGLDPRRPGESAAGEDLEGGGSGDGDGDVAGEAQAIADEGVGGGAGVLEVFELPEESAKGAVFLGEVVDEGGIGVVGALGVVDLDGFVAAVAVVELDGGLGAGLEVGDLDPDEGLAHEGVEFLDVVGERGSCRRRRRNGCRCRPPSRPRTGSRRRGGGGGRGRSRWACRWGRRREVVSMTIFLRMVQSPSHQACAVPERVRMASAPRRRRWRRERVVWSDELHWQAEG